MSIADLYKFIDYPNARMRKLNSKWCEISDELVDKYKNVRVLLREFLSLKSLQGMIVFFYIDDVPATHSQTMYLDKYIDYDIVMAPTEYKKIKIYTWTSKNAL